MPVRREAVCSDEGQVCVIKRLLRGRPYTVMKVGVREQVPGRWQYVAHARLCANDTHRDILTPT